MKYRLYKKWICKSEAENFNNICLIVISTGNVIVYSTEKKKKKTTTYWEIFYNCKTKAKPTYP